MDRLTDPFRDRRSAEVSHLGSTTDAISVLHLDDGRQWRGGQHQVSLLAEGLAELGVRQTVAARPDGPLARRLATAKIAVVDVDFRGEWDWRAPKQLADLVRREQFHIVHAHTAHTHSLALRMLRDIERKGAPSRLVALSTRRVDFPVGRGFFSRRKYAFPRQHFIAISNAVRAELVRGGVAPERIDLVHSGVPPLAPDCAWSRERARAEFGIAPETVAIISVGALTEHKGHRWLIEAAPGIVREFPSARIWIFGEGELRRDLEHLIAQLGLEGVVTLSGHVPDARLKLAAFDLFVSPSHLEGLGTSILDAMLAGLPVIAASAGGVVDVVREGETGRLVPPRDPAALASVVLDLLRGPDAARGRMVQCARESVEREFSARRMVEGTLAVYRKLLSLS